MVVQIRGGAYALKKRACHVHDIIAIDRQTGHTCHFSIMGLYLQNNMFRLRLTSLQVRPS